MVDERLRRWRLVLGGGEADGTGTRLSRADGAVDAALAAVYEPGGGRGRDLAASAPAVARWLGDIRTYFPAPVVRVLQRDAVDRLGIDRLLFEPELLAAVEPDVHLVTTLLALKDALPEQTRDTARAVVRRVVDDLERRLAEPTRQAVRGALHRGSRTRRPRAGDIDWNRTVLANLRNYQPSLRTVVPEVLIGYGRRQQAVQRDIVLAVDQSASMATSVVYAGVFAAALAGVRALRTSLIVFDTAVADLTDQLADPVEVLFAAQLGGGTDINRALAYCERLVQVPAQTVLVLISDLVEGGAEDDMRRRVAALAASGVTVVVLLALSDDGAPAYDAGNAAALSRLGVPCFACTPSLFPELLAAAVQGRDLPQWVASRLGG